MDSDKKLKMMKSRIVESYAWRESVIIPLAKDFDVSTEEIENVLFNDMDMSTITNLFATYESAIFTCLLKRIHVDLNLCWLCDTLMLVSKEKADNLKLELANKINDGADYDEVLSSGKKELFNILRNDY